MYAWFLDMRDFFQGCHGHTLVLILCFPLKASGLRLPFSPCQQGHSEGSVTRHSPYSHCYCHEVRGGGQLGSPHVLWLACGCMPPDSLVLMPLQPVPWEHPTPVGKALSTELKQKDPATPVPFFLHGIAPDASSVSVWAQSQERKQ